MFGSGVIGSGMVRYVEALIVALDSPDGKVLQESVLLPLHALQPLLQILDLRAVNPDAD